jgi:8-oxo-dGTP pyrophosphatase MutT (NUDIX family)
MDVTTKTQISAGGIAFRMKEGKLEVALISVGEKERWQLPKGLVGRDEDQETAALREVREETGLETELVQFIDKVEYWYYSGSGAKRVRFHKFVYFYLLRFKEGDVQDHDHEVNEARWVEIGEARRMLAFSSEKKILDQARDLLEST